MSTVGASGVYGSFLAYLRRGPQRNPPHPTVDFLLIVRKRYIRLSVSVRLFLATVAGFGNIWKT